MVGTSPALLIATASTPASILTRLRETAPSMPSRIVQPCVAAVDGRSRWRSRRARIQRRSPSRPFPLSPGRGEPSRCAQGRAVARPTAPLRGPLCSLRQIPPPHGSFPSLRRRCRLLGNVVTVASPSNCSRVCNGGQGMNSLVVVRFSVHISDYGYALCFRGQSAAWPLG